MRILICGGNGSGKSTLGKTLAKALDIKFMDVEDYYFPTMDSTYKYAVSKTREEVCATLYEDMKQNANWIFSSVKGNYGEKIEGMFSCVVLLEVPKKIRLQRVRERSYAKFGKRILPGGDLYEREQSFFDMVKSRKEKDIESWTESLVCPVLKIDGTKPIEENVRWIINWLNSRSDI